MPYRSLSAKVHEAGLFLAYSSYTCEKVTEGLFLRYKGSEIVNKYAIIGSSIEDKLWVFTKYKI